VLSLISTSGFSQIEHKGIINENRNLSSPYYLKIYHNYFADSTPINQVNQENDQETIRYFIIKPNFSL